MTEAKKNVHIAARQELLYSLFMIAKLLILNEIEFSGRRRIQVTRSGLYSSGDRQ